MDKHPDFEESEDIDPEENIRLDNQVKRLELEMVGARFIEHNPEGIELPPALEAQMLDQIMAFEKQKKSATEISLFEYLKKPKFKPIEDLTSEEIILEKERLLKVFARKGVMLSSVMPVEDREMYRFMTQEFFEIPMLNVHIKGFVRQFFYEEFYPNDELLLLQTIQIFFEHYFHDNPSIELGAICQENALDFLKNFRSLYERFENFKSEMVRREIKKIKAHIYFDVEWDAYIENSRKSHRYEGEMRMTFVKKKGMWRIDKITFPPIKAL